MTQLRTASKHILYAVANSFAMNGISSTSNVVTVMPLWQKWLVAADIILGVLAVAGVIVIVRKTQWKKTKQ